MSSVNPHYTFNYVQPEEYRFSHDSVFLARRVFEDLALRGENPRRVLDLCAGCGIVGLDLLFHLHSDPGDAGQTLPEITDFLEVQGLYLPFWEQNAKTLRALAPELSAENFKQLNFLHVNYDTFHPAEGYDLILCNPPYFRPGQGRLSPSDFKNRCRFFLDAGFPELMRVVARALKPQGAAYMLLRPLAEHGISLEEEIAAAVPELTPTRLGDVRGTGLYRFKLAP